MREPLEISDLLVDYDEATLERKPVRREAVVARLRENGQRGAARYVTSLPAPNGILDPDCCDQILLRAHTELQRLNEEFLQADRVRRLVMPLLAALRRSGVAPPYRLVDVGCGLGYVIRALAAHGRLGRDVRLIGCDMNAALVKAASELAEAEYLSCEFLLANAFRLEEPAHVYLSTGVVHHFRGNALDAFFQEQRSAWAFIHHDIQQSRLSPIGSWIFHQSRMREPLARHDGVASAVRAHSVATLLEAARTTTGFDCRSFDGAQSLVGVMTRPMHAVVGVRAELFSTFVGSLGPLAVRLGPSS